MKKLQLLASLVIGLAAGTQAQIEGMGWDNQTQEVVGRYGLGGFHHVEAGLGLSFDDSQPDATVAQEDTRVSFSLSLRYLLALHSWDKLTGFLHAGLYFRDDNNAGGSPNNPFDTNGGRAAALAVFAGYEPQLVLMEHLAVSTRFGLAVPIMPEVKLGLVGDNISIVEGFNFRILF